MGEGEDWSTLLPMLVALVFGLGPVVTFVLLVLWQRRQHRQQRPPRPKPWW